MYNMTDPSAVDLTFDISFGPSPGILIQDLSGILGTSPGPLTYYIVGGDPFYTSYGVVDLSGSGPTFIYTHNGLDLSADSFTYTVKDASDNNSDPATVTLNINMINYPPVVDDTLTLTLAFGESKILQLQRTDSTNGSYFLYKILDGGAWEDFLTTDKGKMTLKTTPTEQTISYVSTGVGTDIQYINAFRFQGTSVPVFDASYVDASDNGNMQLITLSIQVLDLTTPSTNIYSNYASYFNRRDSDAFHRNADQYYTTYLMVIDVDDKARNIIKSLEALIRSKEAYKYNQNTKALLRIVAPIGQILRNDSSVLPALRSQLTNILKTL